MLVVAPNLTVDRRVYVPPLVLGTVARSTRTEALPGGKPVNVVRAMQAHHLSAELVALVPQQGGSWVVDGLRDEGILVTEVPCPGSVRDVVVLYEDDGRVTVINGQGPELPADDWQALLRAVSAAAGPHGFLVCAGSLPPGVPEDALAQLTAAAHQVGAAVILDAGPGWLAPALGAHPDLVSPNLDEAEATLSGAPLLEKVEVGADAEARACAAAAGLVALGARGALVSAGSAGVALCDDAGRVSFVRALRVEVVNPVGAGDSLLGGVAARLAAGDGLAQAARWGVATAAAAISQTIPGRADAAVVRRLLGQVPEPVS